MPETARYDVVDFEQLQQTRTFVRHLLDTYAGIYIAETEGCISIWFLNPAALVEISNHIADIIAETVDTVTKEILEEASVLPELLNRFGGCTVDPVILRKIHQFVHMRVAEAISNQGVTQRLESALVYALYPIASQVGAVDTSLIQNRSDDVFYTQD